MVTFKNIKKVIQPECLHSNRLWVILMIKTLKVILNQIAFDLAIFFWSLWDEFLGIFEEDSGGVQLFETDDTRRICVTFSKMNSASS